MFNIAIQAIYIVVFNEFIYENQSVTEIDTHLKFIEKNKRKKLCARLHMLKFCKNINDFILKN